MNIKATKYNSLYRILSSLVLIIFTISSVYISGNFLIFIISAILFIMTYEWVSITENLNNNLIKSTKSLFNVIIFLLSTLSLKFSIIFFIIVLFLNIFSKNTSKISELFVTLGPIYLCLPFIFLHEIRISNNGFEIILWFLFVVWSTDIFSYIFGKYYGGKKLWISLSPNKTWSGFILGILVATLTSVLCFYINDYDIIKAVFFGFIIAFTTQFGDLLESWIKRKHLIKDSGKLIPGHGGILDRLDGLMLSSLFLYIGFKLYA